MDPQSLGDSLHDWLLDIDSVFGLSVTIRSAGGSYRAVSDRDDIILDTEVCELLLLEARMCLKFICHWLDLTDF